MAAVKLSVRRSLRHVRGSRGIRGEGFGASRVQIFASGRNTVLPCVWSIEVIALKTRKSRPLTPIGERMATTSRNGAGERYGYAYGVGASMHNVWNA